MLSYPRETVIAEKFQAMFKLGIANTYMKDFHDLKTLSELVHFESKALIEAIRRTSDRRKTPLPINEPPTVLNEEVYATAPPLTEGLHRPFATQKLDDSDDLFRISAGCLYGSLL
jgi:hypothetical protein